MSFMGNLAKKKYSHVSNSSEYRIPVDFDYIKVKLLKELAIFSRIFWTNFGYTGTLDEPWHDSEELMSYVRHTKKVKKGLKRPFDEFYRKFNDLDISVKAYGILLIPLVEFNRFEYPLLCLYHPDKMKWFKDLRSYCKSRENVDRIADFMYNFYQLQIEHSGRSYVNSFSILKEDDSGRRLGVYYDVFNRIRQLDSKNIDPGAWLEVKFEKVKSAFPRENVSIKTIVNINGFELGDEELKSITEDPWRKIRLFLGLSPYCEFPHGYIPKGWRPLDPNTTQDIVRVEGNGFYYDKKGSQRRGSCHYISNNYLIIKCDPSNFDQFRDSWDDSSLKTKKPTWEEYRKWAVYPGMYTEDGSANNNRIKGIKWRKK